MTTPIIRLRSPLPGDISLGCWGQALNDVFGYDWHVVITSTEPLALRVASDDPLWHSCLSGAPARTYSELARAAIAQTIVAVLKRFPPGMFRILSAGKRAERASMTIRRRLEGQIKQTIETRDYGGLLDLQQGTTLDLSSLQARSTLRRLFEGIDNQPSPPPKQLRKAVNWVFDGRWSAQHDGSRLVLTASDPRFTKALAGLDTSSGQVALTLVARTVQLIVEGDLGRQFASTLRHGSPEADQLFVDIWVEELKGNLLRGTADRGVDGLVAAIHPPSAEIRDAA